MAVGDLYNIIVTASLFGQQVINSYFYKEIVAPTEGPGWEALAGAFTPDVIGPLRDVQSTQLIYTQGYFNNTDDPTDFGTIVYAAPGSVGGDCLPPFAAWSFKYNRTTRLVRNGHKRIAGVPESYQINGVATEAALLLLDAAAAALTATLNEVDGAGQWKPQIVSRTIVGGSVVYTPYDAGEVDYTFIGTQNSRKFGRGA